MALDSFKGSLTSREAGEAVAAGLRDACPDVEVYVVPVADGGEGTAETIVEALGGEWVRVEVSDPLGRPVNARYGLCGGTAVIEVAAASGLPLVPKELRNPLLTTSRGTGELIADALARGCRKFLVGLGGSAINDAGVGMLRALGFEFLDAQGLPVGEGGGELERIEKVDVSNAHPALSESEFMVACDVTNPLCGPDGASHVFGPQKGATPEMAERLDKALGHFARLSGDDLAPRPGAGAAGGIGYAFLAYLRGRLLPGVEMVLDAVGMDRLMEGADLAITGEGRLDRQTCMGKAPAGVLSRARSHGVPTVALGGGVDPEAVDALQRAGFAAVLPIVPEPQSLDEAMRPATAKANLRRTARQLLSLLLLGALR